jgi:hypothetical protein
MIIAVVRRGVYKLRNGHEVCVLSMKLSCRGYMRIDNVYHLHRWTMFGNSYSNNKDYDIVEFVSPIAEKRIAEWITKY